MKRDMEQKSAVLPAAVLGIGIVLAAAVGSYTFYAVRSFDNTLSVTGSAKTRVEADVAKLTFNVSRTAPEDGRQNGYVQLEQDMKTVKAFLAEKGVAETETTISPIFMEEVYKYNPSGSQLPREFTLRQSVNIESTEVAKVTALAASSQELAAKNIFVGMQLPEYHYSKLADLRVSLLADAIKDAKARAEQIAAPSGRRVGKLKAASSGVVQVLAPNSVEVSDYGQYDLWSIEKDVMVTVRGTFLVR